MKEWKSAGWRPGKILMYLPDSNIFILAFNGSEKEKEFLTKIVDKGELILSVITVTEVLAKANPAEEQIIRDLIDRFPTLPINMDVSEVASVYRRNVSSKFKRVILLDCFLAAQAKLNNLTLVTRNISDFPMKDIKVRSP